MSLNMGEIYTIRTFFFYLNETAVLKNHRHWGYTPPGAVLRYCSDSDTVIVPLNETSQFNYYHSHFYFTFSLVIFFLYTVNYPVPGHFFFEVVSR